MSQRERAPEDLHYYQVDVDFDDRFSSVGDSEAFFRAKDKHDAVGIGHDRTRTSTMFIASVQPLDLDELTEDLGEIKILEVRKS